MMSSTVACEKSLGCEGRLSSLSVPSVRLPVPLAELKPSGPNPHPQVPSLPEARHVPCRPPVQSSCVVPICLPSADPSPSFSGRDTGSTALFHPGCLDLPRRWTHMDVLCPLSGAVSPLTLPSLASSPCQCHHRCPLALAHP